MDIDLPHWSNDDSIEAADADVLEQLDLLRVRQPIIHQLIMGRKTAASMATILGWPKDHITWQLREYKKEGLVYDREGIRSIEWLIYGDSQGYLDLKDWVLEQRRRGGLFNPIEE